MYFLKKPKKIKKRDFLGPIHRVKNNMFFGFREKGGLKFELKIREKGQKNLRRGCLHLTMRVDPPGIEC